MTVAATRRHRQQLPKFWRPKISTAQVLDARIVHNDLVNRLATGAATAGDLWDWMETGFTYTQMMRMLAEDGEQFTDEAMAALALALEICEPITQSNTKLQGIAELYEQALTKATRAAAQENPPVPFEEDSWIAVRY